MFQYLAVLTFVCITEIGSQDVRLPPDIITGPPAHTLFRDADSVTLECVASGIPKPRYEWKKGNTVIDPNDPRIVWQDRHNVGTITIKDAQREYAGYYQCHATNSFGTALSNVSFVERAFLGHFKSGTEVAFHTVMAGDSMTLTCEQIPSVPAPTYTWALVTTVSDTNPATYRISERVQIDDLGNLQFAHTLVEDEYNKQKLYKCQVFNSFVDVTVGGSYANFSVVSQSPVPTKAPVLSFITPSPLVGVVGGTIKMRCLFSGNPAPKVKWRRLPQLPPPSRWTLDSELFGTEATLTKIEPGDEGDYFCDGYNTVDTISKTIHLKVEAAPSFLKSPNHLSSRNVTNGGSVTFTCTTNAVPPAAVIWYQNGVVLNANSLPNKYRMSSDGLNLTVSGLCKNCADGTNDLTVIQCNASNHHGYVMGQGFVNVIDPTVITAPQTILNWEPKMEIVFPCNAKSDDLTPIYYKWTFNDQNLVFDINTNFDPVLQELHIKTENDEDSGRSRVGNYMCTATNNYSSASVMHVLSATGAATSSSELWWIALVVALILLIIICILIIICVCMQNRGDSYSVDDKERLGGNNPEQELQADGFHDYQRPERVSSKASLTGSVQDRHSVGGNSLEEYGQDDHTNYGEDGSFLGKYESMPK